MKSADSAKDSALLRRILNHPGTSISFSLNRPMTNVYSDLSGESYTVPSGLEVAILSITVRGTPTDICHFVTELDVFKELSSNG